MGSGIEPDEDIVELCKGLCPEVNDYIHAIKKDFLSRADSFSEDFTQEQINVYFSIFCFGLSTVFDEDSFFNLYFNDIEGPEQ